MFTGKKTLLNWVCPLLALSMLLLVMIVILPAKSSAAISEQQTHAIGIDAYLYFYPLITMDVTRKQCTNIELGKEVGRGPMNNSKIFLNTHRRT